MTDKVGAVVGVTRDAIVSVRKKAEAAEKVAQLIQENTDLSYPVFFPNFGMMTGRPNLIASFPKTIFVENLVSFGGATSFGSYSLNKW